MLLRSLFCITLLSAYCSLAVRKLTINLLHGEVQHQTPFGFYIEVSVLVFRYRLSHKNHFGQCRLNTTTRLRLTRRTVTGPAAATSALAPAAPNRVWPPPAGQTPPPRPRFKPTSRRVRPRPFCRCIEAECAPLSAAKGLHRSRPAQQP